MLSYIGSVGSTSLQAGSESTNPTKRSFGFAIIAVLLVRRIVRRLVRVIIHPTLTDMKKRREEEEELARVAALLETPSRATTPWTQLAGRKCQVCRSTIVTMKDGVGCIGCGDAIHLERCAAEHAARRHAMHASVYR